MRGAIQFTRLILYLLFLTCTHDIRLVAVIEAAEPPTKVQKPSLDASMVAGLSLEHALEPASGPTRASGGSSTVTALPGGGFSFASAGETSVAGAALRI